MIEFGLLWGLRNPDPSARSQAELYRDTLEEIVAAEELGYESVWLTEHHFVEDGYLSSPMTLLAAIAARTSRVRLGPYVALMSLHHPIRFAEDAAVVDLVSDGRLDLALGVGYKLDEFEGLSIDRTTRGRRTDEGVQILQQAWADRPVEFSGRVYDVHGVSVTPKPVQRPIPIFLGANSRPVLERIARLGVAGLAGRPLRGDVEYFHAQLDLHGRDRRDVEYLPFHYLWVDRDHTLARRIALPAAEYVLGGYRQWGSGAAANPRYEDGDYDKACIMGDPAYCIERLEAFLAKAPYAPVRRLILNPPLLGFDHAESMRMIETFATEVAPHFRDS